MPAENSSRNFTQAGSESLQGIIVQRFCLVVMRRLRKVGASARGGVAVKREVAHAHHLSAYVGERLVEFAFVVAEDPHFYYPVHYVVDLRLVVEVATLITNMKITMTTISAKSEKNGTASISVGVEISNINDLDNLIARIEALKDVTSVRRTAQG